MVSVKRATTITVSGGGLTITMDSCAAVANISLAGLAPDHVINAANIPTDTLREWSLAIDHLIAERFGPQPE